MKLIQSAIIILHMMACIPLPGQSSGSGILEIKFIGIRNNKGQVAVGLNRSPEGWPREPDLSFSWKKSNLTDHVFTARIENLNYGTYAMAILDDENSNFEMEMLVGLPREGWGFSMNPPFRLFIPKFSECSFVMDKPFHQISIEMHYALKSK